MWVLGSVKFGCQAWFVNWPPLVLRQLQQNVSELKLISRVRLLVFLSFSEFPVGTMLSPIGLTPKPVVRAVGNLVTYLTEILEVVAEPENVCQSNCFAFPSSSFVGALADWIH